MQVYTHTHTHINMPLQMLDHPSGDRTGQDITNAAAMNTFLSHRHINQHRMYVYECVCMGVCVCCWDMGMGYGNYIDAKFKIKS